MPFARGTKLPLGDGSQASLWWATSRPASDETVIDALTGRRADIHSTGVLLKSQEHIDIYCYARAYLVVPPGLPGGQYVSDCFRVAPSDSRDYAANLSASVATDPVWANPAFA